MSISWKDIEEAERKLLEGERYSPRMQQLLDGIKKIRSENSAMDRAISFFEKLSESEEIQILYFGGFLRDAYLGLKPRDLDLVVHNGWERFQYSVEPFLLRKNRFGGLKLNVHGAETDAWEVRYTDAFNHGVTCPSSPVRLPETTVFNCESIVLDVWAPEGRYWGWERGFFDGCENRTLEMQNPWNSDFLKEHVDLTLCRAHRIQKKLRWRFGPLLKKYVKRQLTQIDPAKIKKLYESHYNEACDPQQVIKHLQTLL